MSLHAALATILSTVSVVGLLTGPRTGPRPTQIAQAGGEFNADWRLLFPDDPVKPSVVDTCSSCHSLKFVLSTRLDQPHWEDTIWTMVTNGAKVQPDEATAMSKYLAQYFGPDKRPLQPPVNINTAGVDQLSLLPALALYADAIVKARREAPFTSANDLLRVEGITKEAIDRARPFVVVN